MPTHFLFLLILLIILAASATKVVSESQRLVVYRLVCEKCGHINRSLRALHKI